MALDGSRQGTQNVGGRTRSMGDRSIAYSSLKMSNHKYNPLHRTRTKCEIIGGFTVAASAVHCSLTSNHHRPEVFPRSDWMDHFSPPSQGAAKPPRQSSAWAWIPKLPIPPSLRKESLQLLREYAWWTLSSRIFLQSFTLLSHFLFLPSSQLPHTCFAFHTLTTRDRTMTTQ